MTAAGAAESESSEEKPGLDKVLERIDEQKRQMEVTEQLIVTAETKLARQSNESGASWSRRGSWPSS